MALSERNALIGIVLGSSFTLLVVNPAVNVWVWFMVLPAVEPDAITVMKFVLVTSLLEFVDIRDAAKRQVVSRRRSITRRG